METKKEIYLNEFCIEITRKCNMKCKHCLRGDAQNVNIKNEYITNVLKDVGAINSFTITGGEPSLNVPAIQFILKELKRLNIGVFNFYIATNGRKTSYSEKFLHTLLDLFYYQEADNEDIGSMVQISNDNYHTHKEEQEESIKRLSAFSFFSVRRTDYNQNNIIAEGRGYNIGGNRILSYNKEIDYEIDENYIRIEDMIYLNAKGQICNNCDYSYDTQEELHLFDINNISFYEGIMEQINKQEKE